MSRQITKLSLDLHGERVRCEIMNYKVSEALVYYDKEEKRYYLFQDIISGDKPNKISTFPYKYSWYSQDNARNLTLLDVKNIFLLSSNSGYVPFL